MKGANYVCRSTHTFICTNKTHWVLKHTHTHILSDRDPGAIASTSPKLPELPSPARHHLALLLAHLGCLCWGWGFEGAHSTRFLSPIPLYWDSPKQTENLTHQMWTTGLGLAADCWLLLIQHLQILETTDTAITSQALLYCHPIPCQLKLGVGGRKSISYGATGGLHSQSGLVLQRFLLSAKFWHGLFFPSPPHLCCFLPHLIKYRAGMLVLTELVGNWKCFLPVCTN